MHVSFYSCTQTHVMHVLVDNGSQLKASEGKGGVGGGGGSRRSHLLKGFDRSKTLDSDSHQLITSTGTKHQYIR